MNKVDFKTPFAKQIVQTKREVFTQKKKEDEGGQAEQTTAQTFFFLNFKEGCNVLLSCSTFLALNVNGTNTLCSTFSGAD